MSNRISISLLALALALPSVATSNPGNGDAASELRTKASVILDHSNALAEIWPGYWPEDQGFILYDPTHGAVLVGAEQRPRNITYRAGELPGAHAKFVFDYPAGAPNMMMMTVKEDWPDAAETLFHEQFHDFQRDAFDRGDWKNAGEYVDLTAISDRAAFTAGAELERRVLADAVLAKTDARRFDLARSYIALRRAREATVGDVIIGKERYFERLEGTAEYVGLTAASVVLGESTSSVSDKLAEGLRRSLFDNAEGSYSGNWFRRRAYGVGGAIAVLLDRSGTDWKARVQAGESLDVVLENTLGESDSGELQHLAAVTRADYGANEILADMTAALAAAPKTIESKADFMQLGSRHLILAITVPRDQLGDGREFSQTKQMIPIGRSATAFLDVIDYQVERPGIELRVQGLSILAENPPSKPGEPFKRIYIVSLDDDVKLAELDNLSRGTHNLAAVDLSINGLTLRISKPVAVTVAQDRITLSASVAG